MVLPGVNDRLTGTSRFFCVVQDGVGILKDAFLPADLTQDGARIQDPGRTALPVVTGGDALPCAGICIFPKSALLSRLHCYHVYYFWKIERTLLFLVYNEAYL